LPIISTESEAKTVLIVAGSDFQDPETSSVQWKTRNGDYTKQVTRLKTIMMNIREKYGNAYGFFGGGDYCFDDNCGSTKTKKGISAVKSAISDVFGNSVNTVFVQGNHDEKTVSNIPDFCSCGENGENDTDYYGVFVFNVTEYRPAPESSGKWTNESNVKQTSQDKAKALASKLESYLSEKAKSGYNKPIFILSHVPLHYSTRTKAESDAIYATYFVDVMNKYGDTLNIFFIFGHDHSSGDDDYLGGSAVFLTYGDEINIALEGNKNEYSAKEIKFTYMNYGYTGYYWAKWVTSPDKIVNNDGDNTLTMTAFLINGNEVTVSRWDENGQHETLKAEGLKSKGLRNNGTVPEACTPNTDTYVSPQFLLNGRTVTDVNRDGRTNILDVLLLNRLISNNSEEAYDVNGDTKIDKTDIKYIMSYILSN